MICERKYTDKEIQAVRKDVSICKLIKITTKNRCPVCDSFALDTMKIRKNSFRCTECGFSGDSITFIMEAMRKPFMEALEYFLTQKGKLKKPFLKDAEK